MDPAPGAERPGASDGESVLELFLEMLLSERGAAAHTVAGYRRDIEQFAASQHRRGSDLAGADATAVRGYLTELFESGLAPRTAARRLSALRQFYRFMQAEDLRADDPCETIEGPRLGRPLPKILSEDQVTALLNAARARVEAKAASRRAGAVEVAVGDRPVEQSGDQPGRDRYPAACGRQGYIRNAR